MSNVISITDMNDWAEASLAKKQLAFFKQQQKKMPQLDYTDAIAKEEALISSFKSKAA